MIDDDDDDYDDDDNDDGDDNDNDGNNDDGDDDISFYLLKYTQLRPVIWMMIFLFIYLN